MCFFFFVLWKFKDIKTLTIAWTAKEDSHLCRDTKDGVVDKDTLALQEDQEGQRV